MTNLSSQARAGSSEKWFSRTEKKGASTCGFSQEVQRRVALDFFLLSFDADLLHRFGKGTIVCFRQSGDAERLRHRSGRGAKVGCARKLFCD